MIGCSGTATMGIGAVSWCEKIKEGTKFHLWLTI